MQLINSDFVRSARRPKILPHLFLGDYEISIWVDGNYSIIGDISELAKKVLSRHNISLFRHPNNSSSVYEEAKKCIELKKDTPAIIEKQVSKYANEGLPAIQIPMTGIIFRRHNDQQIIKTMEHWWTEVCNHSRRDQLSFNYVAWKNGLEYHIIDDYGTRNKWLEKESHQLSKKELFYKKLKKVRSKIATRFPCIKI